MTTLYKFYGWVKDRPGPPVRWLAINTLALGLGGTIPVILNLFETFPDGSYQGWVSFVSAVTFVSLFNVVFELIGLGYEDWKRKQQPAR